MTKESFIHAVQALNRLSPSRQKQEVKVASNKFIHHLCSATCKLRRCNKLRLSPKMKRDFKRYGPKLRALTKQRTSIHKKRMILTQKGGILPFLVPIIVAGIGAAGGVGAAATHAAISKA